VLHPARSRHARRPTVGVVATALAAAALLFALTGATTFGGTTLAATCDGVNLRTGTATSYPIKTTIKAGTLVVASATDTGGSWSTSCAGVAATGNSWYRITTVAGKSVSSLYGVSFLYGAKSLFKAPSSTATPATPPPSGAPPPSTTGPTTLPATITFFGRGWGHGVGLSQYGAYGRALAGQDMATILGHYYQGATLGTMTNAQVRVLVLNGWTASATSPLRLYGRAGTWTIDGIAKTFPADAHVKFVPTVTTTSTATSVTWKVTVDAVDGSNLHTGAATDLRMRTAATTTVLQLYSKPTTYDRYRGSLRIVLSKTSPKVSVVNEVPMETYLRGVVPNEMSSAWPLEALKAQTVASRSYAAYRLRPTIGTWDLYDDTRSQVYRGTLAEKAATNAVVAATAGVVLRSGTGYANTLYHSCGGGATEHNENVFVSSTGAIVAGPLPYLRGSLDRAPDGSSYDKASPLAQWQTATYSLAQIQAFFAADTRTNVGTLVALDLSRRGVSGRLISVTLIGANGTSKTVSGDVFVAVFNARRPAIDPPLRGSLLDLVPIP
jgi:SpoIID/LytB domain protein